VSVRKREEVQEVLHEDAAELIQETHVEKREQATSGLVVDRDAGRIPMTSVLEGPPTAEDAGTGTFMPIFAVAASVPH
jgi:hypothetical protein